MDEYIFLHEGNLYDPSAQQYSGCGDSVGSHERQYRKAHHLWKLLVLAIIHINYISVPN